MTAVSRFSMVYSGFLSSFPWSMLTENEVKKTLSDLQEIDDKCFSNKISRSFYATCCIYTSKKYGVIALQAIRKKNQELWSGAMFLSSYNLSEELVENVFHELPPQPWPINIHQQIAKKLGVTGIIVSNAISYLIYTERVNAQVYGYVFDPEGKIVSESDHYDHTEAEARAKLKEQLSFYERKFEF